MLAGPDGESVQQNPKRARNGAECLDIRLIMPDAQKANPKDGSLTCLSTWT